MAQGPRDCACDRNRRTALNQDSASREPIWYLDGPVSNSGRLKTLLRETAAAAGWLWEIELVPNPDTILSETDQFVATADSGILDRCRRWVNLARTAIEQFVPDATIVRLSAVKRDPS